MNETIVDALTRLTESDPSRTEADIQADIYILLVSGGLNLKSDQVARLEVGTEDGTRRRLDIEVGSAVIEVKKDLDAHAVTERAERQLAGYLETRARTLSTRYAGILTDGHTWRLYHEAEDHLALAAEISVRGPQDHERLLGWLEAVLATDVGVAPSPREIERRLGANSPAHALDHSSLKAIYDAASNVPEVRLKRDLWAKLLRTAFGKGFADDASLFIDHTLLVLTAEIIAHAVVGFDVSRIGSLTPQNLARGTAFADSEILGVVEADFFDWVLEADGGPEFVRALAERISRFDWSHVDHDVLKVLYESVIPASSRAELGEYYTPDWLAERVIEDATDDSPRQRILDPACGSGTFLFHAVRRHIRVAELSGMTASQALLNATRSVIGMDVHPVAVTFARVTYLLAIGRDRLAAEDRPPLSIPVYLGDSMQWEQHLDLLGGVDEITVSTSGDDLIDGGGGTLFGDDLVFPRSVLSDATHFDRLVTAMADRARETSSKSSKALIEPTLIHFGVHETDVPRLVETFDTMRRLHATGRDHIWGYYVRNLVRPLWLTEPSNRVDVLVGNPPWLRYSKMNGNMQERYKTLAKSRGLLSGTLGASGRDLSTLFVVRASELYLRMNGRFGFVMPHGTLTRKPHEGFRRGLWGFGTSGPLNVAFEKSWDLANAPTGFPMVSCVIRGRRTELAEAMGSGVKSWHAKFKDPDQSWDAVSHLFETRDISLQPQSSETQLAESPYKKRFRQGAVLAPIVLLYVVDGVASPLGSGVGRVPVRSLRTNLEKPPWKSLETLEGTVERSFIRTVLLGESIAPYRVLNARRAVLPIRSSKLLKPEEVEEYPGLRPWWTTAEKLWRTHRSGSDDSALLERIDFHTQLSSQLPTSPHRVVYTKAGTNLVAARVNSDEHLIDFSLYWASVSGPDEARYLTSILNSTTLLERVRPLQTLGLFGARHFDKYVFSIAIPTFDSANANHTALCQLAEEAERMAAEVDISTTTNFKSARKAVRAGMPEVLERIEQVVSAVLPTLSGSEIIPEVRNV